MGRGPKALQTLPTAGVKVILRVRGTVRQALAGYKQGELRPASGPDIRVGS
jgi:predicted Fe-Mo cluster-binding NifX family protein